MRNSYKNCFCAISLFAILPTTYAVAATEWPPYQNNLKPQVATSLHKTSLSPTIKISEPDINLPKNISFFSGIWAGSICDSLSDVKIAVVELNIEGASIIYSLGSYAGLFNNQEYSATIIDGELVGRTETGFEIILGKRSKDNYLNVKWMRGDDTQQSTEYTRTICYGVLKRE